VELKLCRIRTKHKNIARRHVMNKSLRIIKNNGIAISVAVLLVISFLFFSYTLPAQENIAPKTAAEAISLARNTGRYLFLLFYKDKDGSFNTMKGTIEEFEKESSKKIMIYRASTANEQEKDVATKYGILKAPLPIVLSLAPNGAVTGGFPKEVSKQQLAGCLVPELTTRILKPLQEGKIVLVLLQNKNTKYNMKSAKAAGDFSDEPQLKGYVEIIMADPGDAKNKEFISQIKLDENKNEAAVVFLVPPGTIAGVFSGKVTKETLFGALAACSSGGGCGSGGCK